MEAREVLDGVFDGFLRGGNIFTNRDVLRHDYIPDKLPHRDEHLKRLGSILAPALSNSKVSNIFVYGKTGTGKTIVVKFVLERLGAKSSELGSNLKICYINCRLMGTNYRVMAEICRAKGLRVPFTGLAVGELLSRFRDALSAVPSAFLVVLDEIDGLVYNRMNDDLLYELTRINEDLDSSWLGIIGVSNDLHFKEFLDPRVVSSLSEEEVVFKPYQADELYDILEERAKIGFAPNVLEESSLRLCAAMAAREHGDARRALDLIRVAGELAEREGDDKVNESYVKNAQQKIEHDRITEALVSLPVHSKILLISAHAFCSHFGEGGITGDIYQVYHELCTAAGMEPLSQRRTSGLINELDAMGILNARVISFGRYGRTKKIRPGISPSTISSVYGEDLTIGRLLRYEPKCLKQLKPTS